ncbi:MAG: translation initiation factor IF-1 [Anaerolineae bacterium]
MSQDATRAKALRGAVRAVLESKLYEVRLENGASVTAHVAPEMRLYNVRLLEGDAVMVSLSPYDPSRGRIISRAER